MRNIRLAIYYQENGKSKTSLGGDEMKKYLALFMGMIMSATIAQAVAKPLAQAAQRAGVVADHRWNAVSAI